MMIRSSHTGDVLILELSGALTSGAGVRSLRQALAGVSPSDRSLVLDLSRVSYMDAAGIGELVRCHSQELRQGGRVVLAGLRGKVREILQLAALLDQVERADNRDEAVRRMDLSRLSAPVTLPAHA